MEVFELFRIAREKGIKTVISCDPETECVELTMYDGPKSETSNISFETIDDMKYADKEARSVMLLELFMHTINRAIWKH